MEAGGEPWRGGERGGRGGGKPRPRRRKATPRTAAQGTGARLPLAAPASPSRHRLPRDPASPVQTPPPLHCRHRAVAPSLAQIRVWPPALRFKHRLRSVAGAAPPLRPRPPSVSSPQIRVIPSPPYASPLRCGPRRRRPPSVLLAPSTWSGTACLGSSSTRCAVPGSPSSARPWRTSSGSRATRPGAPPRRGTAAACSPTTIPCSTGATTSTTTRSRSPARPLARFRPRIQGYYCEIQQQHERSCSKIAAYRLWKSEPATILYIRGGWRSLSEYHN
ncbi:hypothetical protein PVAP13_2NG330106 [Panicum virgatum]|uniref:Uncharacterized protein n=1 Tax=Panicum virgatum TaxID=38727 RepID=A0A8T0VJ46_PANVG|nr:hypothetical protein PVAP13_2NG330106 [Panicum virgatum]